MPSWRTTPASFGRWARARSRRETAVGDICPDDAQPTMSIATPAATSERRERMIFCLLTIGIHHVFEPHPLRVEIQVHVPGAAIAVLADDQFRGAFDLAPAVVHVFAIQCEHHVRVLLHGAACAEIV